MYECTCLCVTWCQPMHNAYLSFSFSFSFDFFSSHIRWILFVVFFFSFVDKNQSIYQNDFRLTSTLHSERRLVVVWLLNVFLCITAYDHEFVINWNCCLNYSLNLFSLYIDTDIVLMGSYLLAVNKYRMNWLGLSGFFEIFTFCVWVFCCFCSFVKLIRLLSVHRWRKRLIFT